MIETKISYGVNSSFELRRLKDFAKINKGKQLKEDEYFNGPYPYINGGMNPSGYINIYNNQGPFIAISEGGASAGYSQIFEGNVWVGAHCYVLKTNQNLKYVYYVLKGFEKEIMSRKTGSAMPNLQKSKFNNTLFPIIYNSYRQENIVKYLDKIDYILLKQMKKYNKKIELLKEYKEALIYETVTKGLDKNVEMKDSGIDWIGLIPKSFSIKRLKDVYIYKNGYSFSDEDYSEEDNGNYLIKITQIKEEGININKEMVIKENYRNKLFKIKKMSILYALSGATAGKSCFFDSEYKCYLNQRVAEIRLKKGNSKYLYYIFKNKQMQNIILNSKQSTAQPNINKSDIDNFIIPYISNTNKQNEIVNFLDKKTKEIDSEVKKLYKKIELIKELKESIIYECVTGKIDIEKEGEKYQKIIESI